MTYSIEWEGNSLDELSSLQTDIAQRIWKKIENAKENPDHFLEKLKGMPEYKIRIGDYRVILLIDRNSQKPSIQAVSHRKNIYKKYRTD